VAAWQGGECNMERGKREGKGKKGEIANGVALSP